MYSKIDEYVTHLIRVSSPERTAWNIERMRDNVPPNWNYIDGCMMVALLSMSDITGDPRYADFAESFIDAFVMEDGTIRTFDSQKHSLDDINEGRVLFRLYEKTGKNKYRLAADRLMAALREQPRTADGNFWHKAIYPNQVWLDGLYMGQVFYVLYEKHFGTGNYTDTLSQFRQVRAHMHDPKTGLYYHGYDASRSAFWADRETGLLVNSECGSFDGFPRSEIDLILDNASEKPGWHPAEKMISGQYILKLCDMYRKEAEAQGITSEEDLKTVEYAVTDRAAAYVCSILCGILEYYSDKLVKNNVYYIVADGSAVIKNERLRTTLERLLKEYTEKYLQIGCEMVYAEGSSLTGTAIAAAKMH